MREGGRHRDDDVARGAGPGVRAVAFDVMDTLVHDPFVAALEAATGLPVAEVFARRRPEVYPAFERGELDEPAYWAHFAEAGVAIDPETFHRVRRAGIRWLPGMTDLLADLDGLVVRATASNYPVWIEELAASHLDGHVDVVLSSHHLGCRKPDAVFYAALLDRLDLPAGAVCFVDDRAVNVEAAELAGLRAHRFTDAATLRAWLADEGVPLDRAA